MYFSLLAICLDSAGVKEMIFFFAFSYAKGEDVGDAWARIFLGLTGGEILFF